MSDSLVIRIFQPQDAPEVSELYRNGMASYKDIPVIGECTAWFADDKLKPGNDMSDIKRYFLDNDDGKKRCFWVAVFEGKIVGCVGAIPSTKYSEEYVELVRMSVSDTCRKMGVGSKMVKVLEEWAKENGFKHVNLSTLRKMHLGVQLYTRNGYIVDSEEEHNVAEMMGSAEPVNITVVHFTKTLVQ